MWGPKEIAPNKDQLMPPLEIGFKRFEENKWDGAIILEQMSEQEDEFSWYYECLGMLYMYVTTNSMLK